MEKLKRRLKNMKESSIVKWNFLLLLVLICALLFINQYEIQYFANAFYDVDKRPLQVFWLDVGQASSTLIVMPNNSTMLIDTGSVDSEREFISSVKLILQRNNLKDIDYLVLTHPDSDHTGGVVELMENFQVYNVLRPKILSTSVLEVEAENLNTSTSLVYQDAITAIYREPNCQVDFVNDAILNFGETYVQIFACQNDVYAQTNDYSPYINLVSFNRSFLFCGDASSDREEEFLSSLSQDNQNLDVDFLQVAHHGSKYSTTTEFLQAIKPEYAFISAQDNFHPSGEVLTRLHENGITDDNIFCTKDDGMIAVGVSDDGNFVIRTLSNFVDLPLIVVLVCLCVWEFVALYEINETLKMKNIFLKNRKLLSHSEF